MRSRVGTHVKMVTKVSGWKTTSVGRSGTVINTWNHSSLDDARNVLCRNLHITFQCTQVDCALKFRSKCVQLKLPVIFLSLPHFLHTCVYCVFRTFFYSLLKLVKPCLTNIFEGFTEVSGLLYMQNVIRLIYFDYVFLLGSVS